MIRGLIAYIGQFILARHLLWIAMCGLLFTLPVVGQSVVDVTQTHDANAVFREYMSNGKLRTTFEDDKLGFILTLDEKIDKHNKHLVLFFYILNRSDDAFTVKPETFAITLSNGREIPSIPADTVIAAIEKKGGWRHTVMAALAGVTASTATNTTTATITDQQGRTSTVEISEPDRSATERVHAQIAQERQYNSTVAAAFDKVAFRAHTLFPNADKIGAIYFKRTKLGKGHTVSFILDGVTYQVPFGSMRRPG